MARGFRAQRTVEAGTVRNRCGGHPLVTRHVVALVYDHFSIERSDAESHSLSINAPISFGERSTSSAINLLLKYTSPFPFSVCWRRYVRSRSSLLPAGGRSSVLRVEGVALIHFTISSHSLRAAYKPRKASLNLRLRPANRGKRFVLQPAEMAVEILKPDLRRSFAIVPIPSIFSDYSVVRLLNAPLQENIAYSISSCGAGRLRARFTIVRGPRILRRS